MAGDFFGGIHAIRFSFIFSSLLATKNPLKCNWRSLTVQSVHKLADCINPIFLFFHFTLVKERELLEELSTDLSA
jgi:hypothetical protein